MEREGAETEKEQWREGGRERGRDSAEELRGESDRRRKSV